MTDVGTVDRLMIRLSDACEEMQDRLLSARVRLQEQRELMRELRIVIGGRGDVR